MSHRPGLRNSNNTSGYRGVSFHKKTGKWSASIRVDGKSKHLGLYATPELAFRARQSVTGEPDSWRPAQPGSGQLPLSDGTVALVDPADFDRLKHYTWNIDNYGYPYRSESNSRGGTNKIRLHVDVVPDCPPGMVRDHKDRDRRNNRKNNIRFATHSQNHWNEGLRRNNTSGCKGVSYHKSRAQWRARIKVNYKEIHLGWFQSFDLAKAAYDRAVHEHCGAFAVTSGVQ